MTWQKFKSAGELICVVEAQATWFTARRARRVIHHGASNVGLDTQKCVRFDNRWQPLHEASEWTSFLKAKAAEGAKVHLEWPITRFKKDALPFILTWEEPGPYYEVFG